MNKKEAAHRWKGMVAQLSRGDAQALLLDLAEKYPEVGEELERILVDAPPETGKQWKKGIDRILKNAKEDGYIPYRRAWRTVSEVRDRLLDKVQPLRQQGRVEEAFDLTAHAFCALGKCDMDDSDGGFSVFGETCLALWAELVGEATPKQQQKMYRWFAKTSETFPFDLYRDCAWQARRDLFRSPAFLRKTLEALDEKIKVERDKEKSWSLPDLVLDRKSILEALGAPQAEIDQVEKDYWHLPEIRQRAVERLLAAGEEDRAIAVLQESKERDQYYAGLVWRYSQQLIALYQERGRKAELVEELRYQLHECSQKDLTNIKLLKANLPEEAWPAVFEELLKDRNLKRNRREMLAWAGDYRRLLDDVLGRRELHSLDKWEEILLPRFPEEMMGAYRPLLEEAMARAGSRKEYTWVIAHLDILDRCPGGEAQTRQLAALWRETYPRRSSMLEEITKAGY
jgi:hypothetical protein